MLDALVQFCQMMVVLAAAPLLAGYVRKVKALLVGRQGPPLLQPYRDLLRLLRKEVVLAHSASWVFRATPYLVFAATWVGAALVPTFATGLLFSYAADMIAIVALLGSARFMLALAGLDVGTSFGGIGSSREMMIASLAEPAMLMVVFTLSLLAGSTQLSTMAAFFASGEVGLRVSLGMALIALIMVAIAEKIITQKAEDFDASKFEDHYEEALRELIAQKQKGKKIVRPEAPKDTNVIDLMDALKASLKGAPERRRTAAAGKTTARKAVAAHRTTGGKRTKKQS